MAEVATARGTIQFVCPRCSRLTRVPAAMAGKLGRCVGCKQALEVPGSDAARAGAPERTAPPESRVVESRTLPCPACAETVYRSARVCRHCGERLDRPAVPEIADDAAMRVAGIVLVVLFSLASVSAVVRFVGHWDLLIPTSLQLLLYAAGIRVGLGLHARERAAFWGWCFLALLSTLGTLLIVGARLSTSSSYLYMNGVELTYPVAGVVLAQWLGCYVIPIALTIRRWSSIRWT